MASRALASASSSAAVTCRRNVGRALYQGSASHSARIAKSHTSCPGSGRNPPRVCQSSRANTTAPSPTAGKAWLISAKPTVSASSIDSCRDRNDATCAENRASSTSSPCSQPQPLNPHVESLASSDSISDSRCVRSHESGATSTAIQRPEAIDTPALMDPANGSPAQACSRTGTVPQRDRISSGCNGATAARWTTTTSAGGNDCAATASSVDASAFAGADAGTTTTTLTAPLTWERGTVARSRRR